MPTKEVSTKASKVTMSLMIMASVITFGIGISHSPSPSFAAGCRPLSSSGHCYKAGQLCRQSDAGVKGIALNGSRIVCRNNNGLRWVSY